MKPYYDEDGIVIYCGDCREVIPQLKGIDAIISDPPYGMNWDTNTTRFSGGLQGPGPRGKDWGVPIKGDDKPFDPDFLLSYPKVVLWGFNHFASRLPVGTTLVWVKRNEEAYGSFLSDAEVAWMSGGHGVYCFRDVPCIADRGLHPTQKTIPLMSWCIDKAKVPIGGLIVDPYMGSGSTLVAAKLLGYKAAGVEIEERYCEIAARRLRQGVFDWNPSEATS